MTARSHKHQHRTQSLKSHKSNKHSDPFNYIVYFFTIATPLFELPQLITIYANHSAQNVSAWTWGFFVLDNVAWIAYSARHKMKPVLISSSLYLIIEVAIVIGILKYS